MTRELGVEPALLRQIAQAIEMLAPPRLAKHAHLAGVGPDDVHQDPDERALAGAVRPEQAEDLAGMDVERHAAKRRRVAVALDDVVEREDGHVPKSLLEVTQAATQPGFLASLESR